ISKGSQAGQVTFAFTGAWYGDEVTRCLHPLRPNWSATGLIWIPSLSFRGRVWIRLKCRIRRISFAKSLMTPDNVPMSLEACTVFMKYLANEGFSSDSNCEVELYGGPNLKILEIPNNATAFSHRDTLFTFELYGYSSATIP
ncbi:hypothetical protein F5880DRAFT_1493315, partial [Lentinula raphanica]